ncbi:MAG: nicotinamide-nucleotide adenylyltransferase [Thermoproteus sp. AZ2]|uniref:Nicotinamide-nucleotide adenylyltransferase n=1 Tax=Thermoproteus sp. AZ2 TaxID=1609232 RepID=A0ACC6UYV9_9CREN
MRAAFIGRFQPPHWGHFKAMEWALGRAEELVVVIGSAQYNYILKDPFTAGERIWMLREGSREAGLDLSRLIFIPLENIPNNAAWASHLLSYVPPIDVAYTNNAFVQLLLRSAGIAAEPTPVLDRERYRSTYIRELMLKGDERWRELVPKSVAEIIDRVKGVERLRIAAMGEAEPHRW